LSTILPRNSGWSRERQSLPPAGAAPWAPSMRRRPFDCSLGSLEVRGSIKRGEQVMAMADGGRGERDFFLVSIFILLTLFRVNLYQQKSLKTKFI
jgi:hypothetical protein